MARPVFAGSAPLSPAAESLSGAAPQLLQQALLPLCLRRGHRGSSVRGFVENGATAKLATGPLQHPSVESHCPQAIKRQFAERKPLRPHAPNCSVQAALESPPPQESRRSALAGKSIFYKTHNGPLTFKQVLGVGNSLPVGRTLRRK